MKRYLYHCFPRRGALLPVEVEKGCAILESIRDYGLLMAPEHIEWRQPTANGGYRVFPVLQTRVCFTDLAPSEVREHARRFGHFALEYEFDAARSLGATPVFYVPQSTAGADDGTAIGIAMMAIAMDASSVIGRMAQLNEVLIKYPSTDDFDFNVGFAGSPEGRKTFKLNAKEVRRVFDAITHATTPISAMSLGLSAFQNYFYPTDNKIRDDSLAYYNQREWRIACSFEIKGQKAIFPLMSEHKRKLLEIDPEFFDRQIKTDTHVYATLEAATVHRGHGGKKAIEMARRIMVPEVAVDRVRAMLSSLASSPDVVAIESLPALV